VDEAKGGGGLSQKPKVLSKPEKQSIFANAAKIIKKNATGDKAADSVFAQKTYAAAKRLVQNKENALARSAGADKKTTSLLRKSRSSLTLKNRMVQRVQIVPKAERQRVNTATKRLIEKNKTGIKPIDDIYKKRAYEAARQLIANKQAALMKNRSKSSKRRSIDPKSPKTGRFVSRIVSKSIKSTGRRYIKTGRIFKRSKIATLAGAALKTSQATISSAAKVTADKEAQAAFIPLASVMRLPAAMMKPKAFRQQLAGMAKSSFDSGLTQDAKMAMEPFNRGAAAGRQALKITAAAAAPLGYVKRRVVVSIAEKHLEKKGILQGKDGAGAKGDLKGKGAGASKIRTAAAGAVKVAAKSLGKAKDGDAGKTDAKKRSQTSKLKTAQKVKKRIRTAKNVVKGAKLAVKGIVKIAAIMKKIIAITIKVVVKIVKVLIKAVKAIIAVLKTVKLVTVLVAVLKVIIVAAAVAAVVAVVAWIINLFAPNESPEPFYGHVDQIRDLGEAVNEYIQSYIDQFDPVNGPIHDLVFPYHDSFDMSIMQFLAILMVWRENVWYVAGQPNFASDSINHLHDLILYLTFSVREETFYVLMEGYVDNGYYDYDEDDELVWVSYYVWEEWYEERLRVFIYIRPLDLDELTTMLYRLDGTNLYNQAEFIRETERNLILDDFPGLDI
jgi:hypothetical protein